VDGGAIAEFGRRLGLAISQVWRSGAVQCAAAPRFFSASYLSRGSRTMEGNGLVRFERGERVRITPKVIHDRVEFDLPVIGRGPRAAN